MPYYNYKKAFSFRNLYLFIRASIKKTFFCCANVSKVLSQQTKSAVIPYEKVFILLLISSDHAL